MSLAISLRSVSYRYGGADDDALRDITLDINRGEVVALIGAPGAGTSTLLLVLGGYAPRLVGGALFGELVREARRPAIVFATPWTQVTGLCRTVFAEIAFGPASLGWPREVIRAAVADAMQKLGITHLAERDPTQLSGGELQRVIVASAIAMGPDLLLLDDPAAELDPKAADSLYVLLTGLASAGAAVVVATPDVERARRSATRTIRMAAGRVATPEPGREGA